MWTDRSQVDIITNSEKFSQKLLVLLGLSVSVSPTVTHTNDHLLHMIRYKTCMHPILKLPNSSSLKTVRHQSSQGDSFKKFETGNFQIACMRVL